MVRKLRTYIRTLVTAYINVCVHSVCVAVYVRMYVVLSLLYVRMYVVLSLLYVRMYVLLSLLYVRMYRPTLCMTVRWATARAAPSSLEYSSYM